MSSRKSDPLTLEAGNDRGPEAVLCVVPPVRQCAEEVEEDQVQGCEPRLAINQEAALAVLVGVDERSEEELRCRGPAGATSAVDALELLDESTWEGREHPDNGRPLPVLRQSRGVGPGT